MTLGRLLAGHPAADGDVLVHTSDVALTRAEVLARIGGLGDAIGAVAGPGRPVAVVADGVDALIAMFACWRAGAVFVPINPRQPDTAVDAAIARTDPAAVVRAGAVSGRKSTTVHDGDAAFLLWTSGTTGEPAPILHTHTAYLELIDRVVGPLRAQAGRGDDIAPSRSPSPNLIPVSMALNAGIYNALFGLRVGAPLVLMDRFTTTTFAELVGRHGIRSTVLPPAAITMLNDDPSIPSLAPLRYVRSITAPLSPFQARRFTRRFGAFVLNGYGQAEIGEVIGWTAAEAKTHADRIGAVGRPHPGVEVRIDRPDADGIGELLVRPPNTAVDLGPDRRSDDGYVRTGDLARIDDAGFVWIEGRRSDLINRGGNKVFPDEVEEVLATVPGVTDVAVVGRPDDRLGRVPVAVVVGDAGDDAVIAAARAVLAPYKVPVAVARRDALPRNAAGKVLRRVLVDELEGAGP